MLYRNNQLDLSFRILLYGIYPVTYSDFKEIYPCIWSYLFRIFKSFNEQTYRRTQLLKLVLNVSNVVRTAQ